MVYTRVVNETAHIAVPGDFTSMKCKELKLDYETAKQSGCTKVVVDFSNTNKLDSRAHQCLAMMRRDIKPENFAVINIKGQPLDLLETSNCEDWIHQP